jgi:uncharacterized protein GlcG (DUF336 family)
MKKRILSMILGATASAFAQTPPAPPARGPAVKLALEAAQAAIDSCTARQQAISVSIVDSAGVLKALVAADGVHARGVASSTSKATTALSFKTSTKALSEQAKNDTALAERIAANPAFNARAGGVPILADGAIIGAIGVGGARGSDIDDACALAGLAQVQSRLR